MLEVDKGVIIGLIKFFSCKKYAEDLLNGKLFCHESGWFRKLDDSFRGDKYDGKKPINVNGQHIEWCNISGIASGFITAGFKDDDKLPLYCLSVIDINILNKTNDKTYFFKSDFVEKMKQFGEYVVLITNYVDFFDAINEHKNTNDLALSFFNIEYVNIENEYTIENVSSNKSLKPFFIKDLEYAYQNEIRFLWQRKDGKPLIDCNNNSIMFDIKHKINGSITSIEKLLDTPFIFS